MIIYIFFPFRLFYKDYIIIFDTVTYLTRHVVIKSLYFNIFFKFRRRMPRFSRKFTYWILNAQKHAICNSLLRKLAVWNRLKWLRESNIQLCFFKTIYFLTNNRQEGYIFVLCYYTVPKNVILYKIKVYI